MPFVTYLHFVCFIAYVYMMVRVARADPHTPGRTPCLYLFACFALWSLCFTFIHNVDTPRAAAAVLLDVSAVGGIGFCGFLLAFTCGVTRGSGTCGPRWMIVPVFLPPLLFVAGQWSGARIMTIAEGVPKSYGWAVVPAASTMGALSGVYPLLVLTVTAVMLVKYRLSLPPCLRRAQADIILYSYATTAGVGVASTIVLPWSTGAFPHLGDAFPVFLSLGLVRAMDRYRFLELTTQSASEDILQTMSDAVFLVDARGLISYVNRAAEILLGRTARRLGGAPFGEFFRDIVATSDAVVQGGGAERFEGNCDDGGRTPVLLTRVQLGSADGAIRGHAWVVRDVTRHRGLERELVMVEGWEQVWIGRWLRRVVGRALAEVANRARALGGGEGDHAESVEVVLEGLCAKVDGACAKVRGVSRSLAPVAMGAGGLIPGLRALASEADRAPEREVVFRHEGTAAELADSEAGHLYRIAQEALGNALAHAEAHRVEILLRCDAEGTALTVRDDGRGLTAPRPNGTGMGFRTMGYRARQMGARLRVSLMDEGGTEVECRIPSFRPTNEVPT